MAKNVGVRLCSTRLRDVLDRERGPRDEFQWLDAVVIDGSGVKSRYLDPTRGSRQQGPARSQSISHGRANRGVRRRRV
jgi:hypothetical protein